MTTDPTARSVHQRQSSQCTITERPPFPTPNKPPPPTRGESFLCSVDPACSPAETANRHLPGQIRGFHNRDPPPPEGTVHRIHHDPRGPSAARYFEPQPQGPTMTTKRRRSLWQHQTQLAETIMQTWYADNRLELPACHALYTCFEPRLIRGLALTAARAILEDPQVTVRFHKHPKTR